MLYVLICLSMFFRDVLGAFYVAAINHGFKWRATAAETMQDVASALSIGLTGAMVFHGGIVALCYSIAAMSVGSIAGTPIGLYLEKKLSAIQV